MGKMWSGGMGGMMGGNQLPTQNPALPFFGLVFAVIIAVTVVGVVSLAYYFGPS